MWMSQEQADHFRNLTIKTVLCGLIAFQDQLIGQEWILMSDNALVIAYMNKQGGMLSEFLWKLTQIFSWLETHDIRMWVRYIPGMRNVITESKHIVLKE